MSQHDMNIANADGATVRADLNNALGALVTNNSGAAAPASTFANMLWADTTAALLKMRNQSNTAWNTVGLLDTANLGLLPLTGGTLSGDVTLDTNAQIFLDDSISSAGANLPLAFDGDANTGLFRPGADILGLATGGNEVGRLTLERYAKFSASGAYIGSTGAYHELRGASNGDHTAVLSHAGSNPFGVRLYFDGATPDNNTNYFLRAEDATLPRCYIYSDGDLQNHDNSYGAISDARLKQDLVPSGSQWDDIKALEVVKWRDKSDVERDGDAAKVMLGCSAQQVETVSPGLVIETDEVEFYQVPVIDDKTKLPLIGKTERRERKTGRKLKGVQYSILYMKAVKALQEAMARIEALEAKAAGGAQ